MKKKLSLILLMCIVSAVLIVIVRNFQESNKAKVELATQDSLAQQNNTADNVDKTEKTSADASIATSKNTNQVSQQTSSNNTTNNSASSKPVANTTTNTNVQVKQTAQPDNITIMDTISGKTIIAKAVEINGLSAADATIKLLNSANISYKTSGFGDTIYFSSIKGLRERGEGALSGWCFYVNGKKPSIGAGAYKLNKDDKLEWKYLKDGSTNN